jgi:hypothetical protein
MQMVTYCRLIKSETAWNLSGSDGSEWKEATAQRRVWRDLVSDALPFGRLWYGEPNAISNAVNCAGGKRFEKASKNLDKGKD